MENAVTFCVKEDEFDAVRAVLLEHGAEWDEKHSEGVYWAFNVKDVKHPLLAQILRLLTDDDFDLEDIPVVVQTLH